MKISVRMVFGVIIVLFGVILLLGSLGVIDSGHLIKDYWPVVLMLFGLYNIIDRESSVFFGVLLLLLGAYLQARVLELDMIGDVALSALIFPAIIILIGIKVLVPSQTGK